MHDIEPYFKWRSAYISEEDDQSPFYGRTYSEFYYSNKVYNYFIHPQWDDFGSSTLYLKTLYADYEIGYVIMELIGEWNDCLHNDIMYLKRDVIDEFALKGISKFILICENVLNFHGSDDCYYEEWYEDIADEEGWICFINTLSHVTEEMESTMIQHYVHLGGIYENVNWRPLKPESLLRWIEKSFSARQKKLL
jgi:hypothetical protein